MNRIIPLASRWQVTYAEPMTGEYAGLHKTADATGWLPAKVPGDCHLDLMRAGRISDPFFGLNSDSCIWMEDKEWWYRTTFEAPALDAGQKLFLLFEGLDTLATIYLNGQIIGRHRNMFRPLELDITRKAKEGSNLLVVRLAATSFVPGIAASPETVTHCVHRRLFLRKAQACFGWDITPRLVTVGIWRPVHLKIVEAAEIADAWVRTRSIHNRCAELELQC